MLKRFVIVAILLAVIIVFGVGKDTETEKIIEKDSDVTLDNASQYKYFLIKLEETDNINLVDNTEKKSTFDEIVRSSQCKKLINGGFYKKENGENSPIGLFKSGGIVTNPFSINSLFNGVLNINSDNLASIKNSENKDSLISLQSGPILIDNKMLKRIELDADKKARRIVAAVDSRGTLYFLTIFNENSVFLGPTLEELPEILQKAFLENNLDILSAINLDGGSASFFSDGTNKLNESVFVGSYFCIN